MPGRPHGWAHDRAKHIRKKNPDLPEGAEYGIAQLQEVAVGKEKDHGGKVKPSTKQKAKKKHKKSPSSYEQKAAPKSKKKKSKKKKGNMKDVIQLIVEASNHFDSIGEVDLANTLDSIGNQLIVTAKKDDDDDKATGSCGCDDGPVDSNTNGICESCGLVYSEDCGCGETELTGCCLGCQSTQPLFRVMVASPSEEMVVAFYDEDGQFIKTSGAIGDAAKSGVGSGVGYVAGRSGGGAVGRAVGNMVLPGIGGMIGGA